jgi:uncharacterized RDD family membrane protein YckC
MVNASSTAPATLVHSRIHIRTPEQMEFVCELAGLAPRMLAWMIDGAIRMTVAVAAWALINSLSGGLDFGFGILLVVNFILEWWYFTILEWRTNGVTPGKRALSLRVIRTDGAPVDLYRSAMRNFLRAADSFPMSTYGVGILAGFISGQGRRIGDLVADTMVISEERVAISPPPKLPRNVPTFSPDALTKAGVNPRLIAWIDSFFRRRGLFTEARAQEIAVQMAAPLSEALGCAADHPEALLAGVLISGADDRVSFTGQPADSSKEAS